MPVLETVTHVPLLAPLYFGAPDAAAPEVLRDALEDLVDRGLVSGACDTFDAARNLSQEAALLGRMRRYRATGRLLDLRAGIGARLHAAALDGWEATGHAAADQLARWGRLNLGLDLVTDPGLPLPYPDATVDVAIGLDTAEWPDLPALLVEVRRVLRPGGALVLGGPNAEALGRRLAGSSGPALAPAALRRALEAAGYTMVRTRFAGLGVLDLLDRHRDDRAVCLEIARVLEACADHTTLEERVEVLAERPVESATA